MHGLSSGVGLEQGLSGVGHPLRQLALMSLVDIRTAGESATSFSMVFYSTIFSSKSIM